MTRKCHIYNLKRTKDTKVKRDTILLETNYLYSVFQLNLVSDTMYAYQRCIIIIFYNQEKNAIGTKKDNFSEMIL